MTFRPSGLGEQVFKERYALNEGETWDECARRVAKWAASCEDRDKIAIVEEQFYRIISEGLFMPGGRILYAAGRSYAQGLNCFVLPVSDSREGIGKLFHDTMVVSGTGGGIGVNFSGLRGRGAAIHGMGGSSTGAVSFMKAQNSIGEQIIAGGSRRTALMQCLNIDHPDILEFISAKTERHELNNANISIVIPQHMDDKEFTTSVRRGGKLPLTFNGKETGEYIDSAEVWNTIVQNAWDSGEPGVLNGALANRTNSISYAHPLISTNPCGEIWLPAYGCCDLGALVLPRFVLASGRLDYDKIADTVYWAVRFLDNILTVNHYPLPEIKQMAQAERRIGLGVMGLHSMLLDMGIRYSEASTSTFDLFLFLQNEAYYSSARLAGEKGPFPLFTDQFNVDRLNVAQDVKIKIRATGLRNCAMMTVAPTGTTSIVQGVTSGIEPLFSPVYIRRRFVNGEVIGDRYHDATLVISKDYIDHPELAEGAYDLDPEYHFLLQYSAQRGTDNAVSKTINLAKDYPLEKLSSLWLDYLPNVKGTTFYREGSRANEPLEYVRTDKVSELLLSWTGDIENEDGTTTIDPCLTGACDI